MGYKEQRLAEIEAEQIRLTRRSTELYKKELRLRDLSAYIQRS